MLFCQFDLSFVRSFHSPWGCCTCISFLLNHNYSRSYILLMEEIQNDHLGYINLANNGINYLSTSARFLPAVTLSEAPIHRSCDSFFTRNRACIAHGLSKAAVDNKLHIGDSERFAML